MVRRYTREFVVTKNLTLSLGALSLPLKEQLENQGLIMAEDDITVWQSMIDSLIRLKVHSLVSSTEIDKISKRIIKEIGKQVRSIQ